jgi:two-component system, CAI-1 autoinducer sensor kinase/phosphatase CqsS
MYSLLPALVSGLFIAYGCYVLAAKGFNRVTGSFFLLCITTFFWQGTWAVLFALDNPIDAHFLVRFGYVLIAFLPTTLYHFLTQIADQPQEMKWVRLSYGVGGVFATLAITSDVFVAGHYRYEWGFYPKAGLLHPLHVLQTTVVVSRGLWMVWKAYLISTGARQQSLKICCISMLCYFVAAIDYLCNYGVDFYPPGVIFIAAGLGMMSYAVARHDLMHAYSAAATIAHELRTPLATIRLQANHAIAQLPTLLEGLRLARSQVLDASAENPEFKQDFAPITATTQDSHRAAHQALESMCQKIVQQVDRSNQLIDMILAAARMEQIDQSKFKRLSMRECVEQTLESYPLTSEQRKKLHLSVQQDFHFHGDALLLQASLGNLIKNSLYAMQVAGKGEIYVMLGKQDSMGVLTVTDTASGIASGDLKRIFETYYSTKQSAGTGVGLALCARVLKSFGGSIRCDSVLGEYTTFTMSVPVQEDQFRSSDSDKFSAGRTLVGLVR